MKNTIKCDFGIKSCEKCEYFLRCEECSYNKIDISNLIQEEKYKARKEILKEFQELLSKTSNDRAIIQGCRDIFCDFVNKYNIKFD
jgi:hypothetical protein